MEMAISIKDLKKTYLRGPQALQGIDLDISRGMFGLLGPNGAGKTTLMRILAALLKPTSGTATVFGFDVERDRDEIRRILGYLPQEYNIYPNLTAYEFLDYMALLQGVGGNRKKLVEGMLETVGLTEAAHRKVGSFSGGMKQRLGIAQALLNDPELLIIDEPTAGLDPEERVRFRNLLAEISTDKVVLLSTHIVADVATTCGDMAILNRGKTVFRGAPAALTATARGRVWKKLTSVDKLDHIKRSYQIVSTVQTVQGLEVRFLAGEGESVPDNTEPASPTLEDAYLLLLGGTV